MAKGSHPLAGNNGVNFNADTAPAGFGGNGNGVDPNPGIPVAQSNVDLGALLPDQASFILPPSGPVEITLGVDGTFTDPGDGVDHVITGDSSQAEADTDTDTFIFGPNNGNDTITDFRYEDLIFNPDGTFTSVPGDSLDLSAYGIFGTDLGPAGFLTFFDNLVTNGLIDSYTVTLTDTVINFTSGDSLTLLGIGENEIGIVIEENMVRDTGGSV